MTKYAASGTNQICTLRRILAGHGTDLDNCTECRNGGIVKRDLVSKSNTESTLCTCPACLECVPPPLSKAERNWSLHCFWTSSLSSGRVGCGWEDFSYPHQVAPVDNRNDYKGGQPGISISQFFTLKVSSLFFRDSISLFLCCLWEALIPSF